MGELGGRGGMSGTGGRAEEGVVAGVSGAGGSTRRYHGMDVLPVGLGCSDGVSVGSWGSDDASRRRKGAVLSCLYRGYC